MSPPFYCPIILIEINGEVVGSRSWPLVVVGEEYQALVKLLLFF